MGSNPQALERAILCRGAPVEIGIRNYKYH
jgi:hypothetical protein